MGAVLFFLWIFFILLSKKVSYLLTIIKGIEKMDAREMDFSIPEEGNDELAELAACINRLACSQRELRFREQSLRDERERFIRSMSHDIRTPMNAIVGMAAIAAAHINDRDRVSECLKKIGLSSKHLLSLINDVLDMSMIESGKLSLRYETFNFAELISDLTEL